MHSRLVALLATAALTVGVTAGCGGLQPDSAATQAGPAAAQTPGGDAAGSPGATSPAPGAFGTTTSLDGLDFTVSELTDFQPSKLASYPQGSERFVTVDIMVHNTSEEPLQTMFFTTEATSGGEEAGFVADSDKDVGAPTTAVAPGQSLTWKEAYPMPGNDLALAVSWSPPGGQPSTTALTASAYPTPTPTATATGTATGTGTETTGTTTATQ